MRATVLVTGANGFIGRETVKAVERSGRTVFKGVRHVMGENEIEINLDVPGYVDRLASGPHMDAIVHLAARVSWQEEPGKELFIPNVIGVANLLYLASKWNSHFVFSSTALVCGAKLNYITSTRPDNPDLPYSHSKWLGEQLIRASGVRSTILRVAGVFGLNGPAHLGLNRSISNAIAGHRPQLVGDGSARRNYIYVKDVAEQIAHTLRKNIYGTHFIAGSETLSIAQMLSEICNVFLPGERPEIVKEGWNTQDQVVEASSLYPATRSFHSALADIKLEAY